ncbi:MAG: hypothetical protein EHM21_14550, partial [Chloroflexi bacterium]
IVMAKVQTPFSTTGQGYQFENRFELKIPVKFKLPLAGTVDLNEVVFGLCGGMCFSALDYYFTGTPLPQYLQPGEIDTRLYTYLCERQLDSLQIPVLIKIIDWMIASDYDLAARMIRTEVPRLRRLLDKGNPAVLCLIRTQGFGNPTLNHQVVATGYEADAAAKTITITLYDPSHPGETPEITVHLDRKNFAIEQSTGELLRGFFVIPYTLQKGVPAPKVEKPAEAVSFGLAAAESPEPPFRLKWPVDSERINQRFGENPAMYRPFKLAGHEGLDFFAPTGARIYATFDGVVSEAKYRGAYGNQVRIRHEHNGIKFTTVYAHLDKILATANQPVKAGDLIGLADNTGNSHGSHLHLTLFIDGEKTPGYYDGIVDPWPFMEGVEPPKPLTLSDVIIFTIKEANLRTLPTTTGSEIITLLPSGERLPVFGENETIRQQVGKKDQWLQVQTKSGQTGYIAAWLVADESQQIFPPTDLVVYAFDNLAIRSGPGMGLAQAGVVSPTTPLVVLGTAESAKAKIGQQGQWLQVQAPDGTRGFVPAWLVRVTGQVPPPAGLLVSPTAMVNLRAQPNTNPGTDILAIVTPGDTLTVLGDKDQARAKI